MSSFDDLLAVQELDTRLDQLRHQRSTLPELARRDEAAASLGRAESDAAATEQELRAIRSVQREAEDHAALIGDKIEEIQQSLYDGTVVAHKELESLQAEQAALREKRTALEDEALEQMELAEPVEAGLERRRVVAQQHQEALERAEAELIVATAELDAELERVGAERTSAADRVPAPQLEVYESLRAGLGGIAVARLSGSRCEGCHLTIPSAELEALRRAPADAVVTCPECQRILVR